MTDRATSRARALVGLLAVVLLVSAVPAGAQTDAEAEREDVRRRRAAVDEEIDLLAASDAEIHAALDAIDRDIAGQERALRAAEAAADAAEDAVAEAEGDLRLARRDVRQLEDAIAEMAVASFVHPPTADLVQSLQAASFSDALLQRAYLDARAKRDVELLDLLEVAEATAVERAAAVEVAAAEAGAAVEAAGTELAALRQEQSRHAAFAADLRDRIDASLAEAAVLAELDTELASRIEAEQVALIARIPPPPPPPPIATDEVPSAPVQEDPSPAERTSPPTAPSTTTPPRVPRPNVDRDAPPLATVRGITVHADLAADLEVMLDAADESGIALFGYGYRSTARQIELRRAHCGPSDWDIWYRPASTCQPPTAVPGRSLHEQGRAIDLTSGGRAITSRSDPAFRWLADNAAAFGFFNLPSEPWHWSTTGS